MGKAHERSGRSLVSCEPYGAALRTRAGPLPSPLRARSAPQCGVSRGPRAHRVRVPITLLFAARSAFETLTRFRDDTGRGIR
jgi:hypothetical protein